MWKDWLTGVLGVAVVAIAFVFIDAGTTMQVALAALGVGIALLGFWSGMSATDSGTRAHTRV